MKFNKKILISFLILICTILAPFNGISAQAVESNNLSGKHEIINFMIPGTFCIDNTQTTECSYMLCGSVEYEDDGEITVVNYDCFNSVKEEYKDSYKAYYNVAISYSDDKSAIFFNCTFTKTDLNGNILDTHEISYTVSSSLGRFLSGDYLDSAIW